MFCLHHADGVEPLIDALARVLAVTPEDPFTPDVVVVPAAGLADVVLAGVGRALGVAANVETMFPGTLIARALGTTTGAGTDADPWQIGRLTWAVLETLQGTSVEVPRPSPSEADQWALARRIADQFDRYGNQRPQVIVDWAAGVDSDGTRSADGSPNQLGSDSAWQAQLWREVRARIATPSPPERLGGLLNDLRQGTLEPALPLRINVFGFAALAPTLLAVLQALGASREVHAFVRHPSAVLWASCPHRLAGTGLQLRARVDVTSHVNHPLLASWGRPALEARALLAGLDDVDEMAEPCRAQANTSTVLAAVQRGIRLDQAPTPVEGLDPADGSFQVHACHGALRQLEVLRDALGHAFVADPTLAPHDVVILCPDLETYAPMVEAVMSRGPLPVPVRVGDRSLSTEDPLAGALVAVLGLVRGRATLSDVLDVLGRDPVRRRLGWNVDDLETLRSWCVRTGTRWGWSVDHRRAWGLPDSVSNGTWASLVDALLAGTAISAPTPRLVVGEVVPFDDVDADGVALVGDFADIVAHLVALHARVCVSQPVGHWVDLLHDVVEGFCAAEPEATWRMGAIHQQLEAIAESARTTSGACDVALTLDDMLAVLADALVETPGRLAVRSGSVTVSSLLPQRGVPARVLAIVGLDDGALRAGAFDGDDILGLRPCVGERHPGDDSRQLLLDALLSATDRLIITCTGADLTTNRPVPFTVALQELLDVVDTLIPDSAPRRQVITRHPRHGFGEASLTPGALQAGSSSSFGFDAAMLRAAQARRGASVDRRRASESSRWLLPPLAVTAVEVDDLVDAVINPAKVFVQSRLQATPPGEDEAPSDQVAISLDSLDRYRVGHDLLEARRIGQTVPAWLAGARLAGTVPPGLLGEHALTLVAGEVGRIEDLAQVWSVPLVGTEEMAVDQRIGTSPTVVTLSGLLRGIHGDRLVDVRFVRPKPSHRLGAAVKLAAAELAAPDRHWMAVVITRDARDSDKALATGLRLRGSGQARRRSAAMVLDMALGLYRWALYDAVPLFEKMSSAWHDQRRADLVGALSDDLEDRYTGLLWEGVSLDDLLSARVLHSDPEPVRSDPRPRAAAVAAWVWDTYARCVDHVDQHGQLVGDRGDDAASQDER